MSAEDKVPYEEKSKVDKERYQREMEAYKAGKGGAAADEEEDKEASGSGSDNESGSGSGGESGDDE